MMKSGSVLNIAIGARIKAGAWGGGNLFAKTLSQYLLRKGHHIAFDLNQREPDLILLMHPLSSESASFTMRDVVRYLLKGKTNPMVVLRINNSSESRDDKKKLFNRSRLMANTVADHTVFISRWLKSVYVRDGFKNTSCSIIMNGADQSVFHPRVSVKGSSSKLRIITHHWSDNLNKGFDIYSRLDRLIAETEFGDKVSFTFIGRAPKGFKFQACTHLAPMPPDQIAERLSEYDIYLTASRHEGAGMHHIEAALCGLPLLYIDSGAIPEYCRGFGVMFNQHNFENKLCEMIDGHQHWKKRMVHYPYTAEAMSAGYENLFYRLLKERGIIVENRGWDRRFLYSLMIKSYIIQYRMMMTRFLSNWFHRKSMMI
jgi:glycosyltransferase involved in cell wall biosynthesis